MNYLKEGVDNMNKKKIFIFGHKNPDTDSVCAAIGLSYLKNKLGFNTIPCVLGNINDETKFALDYFKFKVPYHLNDVKLQLRDVNYHKNSFIDKNSTIKDAFDYMNKYSLTGIPVVEGNKKYFGYISLKEIAQEVINGDFHKIDTSYGNILDMLKGEKILKFDKD
jgi:manganese-dependent inorganic pyrophosphatase